MHHFQSSLSNGNCNGTLFGSSKQRVLKVMLRLDRSQPSHQRQRYLFITAPKTLAIALLLCLLFILRSQSPTAIEARTIQGAARWTADDGHVIKKPTACQILTGVLFPQHPLTQKPRLHSATPRSFQRPVSKYCRSETRSRDFCISGKASSLQISRVKEQTGH